MRALWNDRARVCKVSRSRRALARAPVRRLSGERGDRRPGKTSIIPSLHGMLICRYVCMCGGTCFLLLLFLFVMCSRTAVPPQVSAFFAERTDCDSCFSFYPPSSAGGRKKKSDISMTPHTFIMTSSSELEPVPFSLRFFLSKSGCLHHLP